MIFCIKKKYVCFFFLCQYLLYDIINAIYINKQSMAEAAKTNEIFGDQEREIKQKFETDWYSWESVSKKLSDIIEKEKVEEKISARLDALEKGVDKYYDYLKALIDAEGAVPTDLLDGVKAKAESKMTEVQEDVLSAVKEKVGFWKISAIWDQITSKISGTFDGFIDKVLEAIHSKFGGILSIFGIGGVAAATLPDGANEKNDEVTTIQKSNNSELDQSEWTQQPEEFVDDSHEDKSDRYYAFWKNSMKYLLNDRFTAADGFGTVSDAMKTYSMSALSTLKYNDIPERQKEKFTQEQFEKFQTNVLWEDMQILYENIITQKNVNLLMQNSKIKLLLIENNVLDNNKIHINHLTIEQLYILFSLISIHVIGVGGVVIPWIGRNILDKIFTMKDNTPGIQELSREIKDAQLHFENNIISRELLKEFSSQVSNIWESSSFLIQQNELNNITNQEQLKKVLDFRDFIQWEIVRNPKYNLWQQETIESFISFQDVLHLYVFFRGEKSIDTFQSSYMYVYIGNMLKHKSWAYVTNLTELSLSESKNILNEQEKDLVQVLGKKILDKGWLDDLRQAAEQWRDASVEYIKHSPEMLAYIAGIVAILKWTPAGRWVSVLYSLVWKKGIALLVSSWVFAYFYSQLPWGIQEEFQSYKAKFKEEGLDLDALLK